MGKAANLARSGQGKNITRGEGAGSRVSRGATRGRPLDVAKDARSGDFLPLGPHAARRRAMVPTKSPIGTNTAQADGIADGPMGMLMRSDPSLVRRTLSDGSLIIGGKGRPEGEIVIQTPSPFTEPAPVARLAAVEVNGSNDAVGVTFNNKPVLGIDVNQVTSGDSGAMGMLAKRSPRFTAK